MKNKFNCVEMKHKSAEKIQKQLKGLTIQEELEYWNKQTKKLRNKKEKVTDSQSAHI